MSLVTLPVEIVYRIFDHLNIYSTLISVRRVCRRLYTITDTYDRYELDLSSSTRAQIKLIMSIIRPENVIRLILSDIWYITSIDFFLSLFHNHDFCRLRSLMLNQVTENHFDRVLKALTNCPLSSLSVGVCSIWNNRIAVLITLAIVQFKLRKLVLKNAHHSMEPISWPNNCNLTYLSLGCCNYSEYQNILGNLQSLKTLIIRNCVIRDRNQIIFASYSQLLSLTISDCHLSMNDIEFLLAQTPSLSYLKLCSRQETFDSAYNGFSWEQFIKSNISSLVEFELFFSYTLKNNDIMVNIDSLIDSFRTPFWLNEKHWFITCDYYIQRKIINLYTTPMCISKSDDLSRSLTNSFSPFVAIRWVVSPTEESCVPILCQTDGIFNINEAEVFINSLQKKYFSFFIQMLTEIKTRLCRINDNEAKYFGHVIQTNKVSNSSILFLNYYFFHRKSLKSFFAIITLEL